MSLFKFYSAISLCEDTGIYIPICLYLNSSKVSWDTFCNDIYIPICLYLNLLAVSTLCLYARYLHSNMPLFKSITRIPAFFLPYSSTFCRPAKVYKYFTISPSLILRNRSKIVYLSCLQNSVDVRAFLHYRRATV